MAQALLFSSASLTVALLAFAVERFIGWPRVLQRVVSHPVVWVGWLIARLDALLNRDGDGDVARKLLGTAALAAVLALVAALTVPLTLWLRGLPGGAFLEALLAVPLVASKSLREHVLAVRDGLGRGIGEARAALGHIVGRDTAALDESEIAKGAIESLAENASDGVIAPLLWLVVFGLPGAALYKTINTADSMIGYKSDRHLHFGRAAARLDDLVNIPAARATAALFAATAALGASRSGAAAWGAARRDAPHHLSPNAGWSEASMAGALGIRLGGPRRYEGRSVDLAYMGRDGKDPETGDIVRAVAFFDRACLMFFAALAAAVLLSLAF